MKKSIIRDRQAVKLSQATKASYQECRDYYEDFWSFTHMISGRLSVKQVDVDLKVFEAVRKVAQADALERLEEIFRGVFGESG